MSDGIMLVFGEDGVAREYDDTWDITIHCESEEEQKEVWEKLNNLNREVKNSTDTIYRQDAIDALEKWESESTWDEWCYDHKDEAEKYNIISPSSVVFNLPPAQPKPQWIPCSERLPEEAYPVIVTWKNDDPASYYQFVLGKHYTGAAHYKNGKWFWYSSITEDVIMEYGRCDSEEFDEAIKVLAWMPLPEPYEGDEK